VTVSTGVNLAKFQTDPLPTAERRIEAFFVLAERGLRSARILLDNGQLGDTALFAQQLLRDGRLYVERDRP
jgi:hypothetical protein